MSALMLGPDVLIGNRETIQTRFAALATRFPDCVDAFARQPVFRSSQLDAHRRTIERRRGLGSAEAAALDSEFAYLLHATLRSWRIGVRASRLAPRDAFAEAIRRHADEVASLDGHTIDSPDLDVNTVGVHLADLIASLGVSDNQAKLVAGTKILHHLLPDLVPPMDRQWTGRFLGIDAPQWQPARNQQRIFRTVFAGFAAVARSVSPERFVTDGWMSSRTKVLDNALVGFCMLEVPAGSAKRVNAFPETRRAPAASAAKYEPLGARLRDQVIDSKTMSFKGIEDILGTRLPPSARARREWWANHDGHVQARAWLSAGWSVRAVDMAGESVHFVRERY